MHAVSALREAFKEFDPHILTQEVVKLGTAWSEKDANASGLEETRKSLLAQLVLEYVDTPRISKDGKIRQNTQALAEQQALSDDRYTLHLEMMVLERKEANIARVKYDMGKMKLELTRSLQATLRQEMHMTSSTR